MAHKKGVGSSQNGRESASKRLGIKIYGGQMAKAGNIIVRQRGTVHNPGLNVGIGKDHTIFAMVDGVVAFKKKASGRSYISVIPPQQEAVFVSQEQEKQEETFVSQEPQKEEVVFVSQEQEEVLIPQQEQEEVFVPQEQVSN
jgi:large subunit ribosomal protein L27